MSRLQYSLSRRLLLSAFWLPLWCEFPARAQVARLYITADGTSIRTSSDSGTNWSVFVGSGLSNVRGIAADRISGAVFASDRGAGTAAVRPVRAFDTNGTLVGSAFFDDTSGFNHRPLGFFGSRLYLNASGAAGAGIEDGLLPFANGAFAATNFSLALDSNWNGNDIAFARAQGTNYMFVNGTSGTGLRRRRVQADGTLANQTAIAVIGPGSDTRDFAFTPLGRLIVINAAGIWMSATNQVTNSSITVSTVFSFSGTETPASGDMGPNGQDFVLLGNRLFALSNNRVYEYTVDDAAGTVSFVSSSSHGFSSATIQIAGFFPLTNRTWDGDADGQWGAAANWDGNAYIPFDGDSVTFPDVVNQTVAVGDDRLVGAVTLNAPDAYTFDNSGRITLLGAINQNGSGAVTFNGPLTLATNQTLGGTGAGAVTFAGGLTGSNAITVAAGNWTVTADNSTTLVANSRWTLAGGVLSASAVTRLGYAPASVVTNYLAFDGGTFRPTAGLTLGNRGVSVLSGGGTLDNNGLNPGLTFNTASTLNGPGTLTLRNGGRIEIGAAQPDFSGTLRLGNGAGAGNSRVEVRFTGASAMSFPGAIQLNDRGTDGPQMVANYGSADVTLNGAISFTDRVTNQPHFFVSRFNGARLHIGSSATISAANAGDAGWIGFRAGFSDVSVTNIVTIAGAITDGAGAMNVAYADGSGVGNWIGYRVSGNNTYSGGGTLQAGPAYGNLLGTHLQKGFVYWQHTNALGLGTANNPISVFRRTGGIESRYAALLADSTANSTLGNDQPITVRPPNSAVSVFMIGGAQNVETLYRNAIIVTNAGGGAPSDQSAGFALLLHQAAGGSTTFTNQIAATGWTTNIMRAPVLEKTGAGQIVLTFPTNSFDAVPVIRNGRIVIEAHAPATGDVGVLGDPTLGEFALTNAVFLGAPRAGSALSNVRIVTLDDIGGTYNASGGANGIGQLTGVANGSAALDNTTLAVNDRVLVILQGNSSTSGKASQNGVYRVTSVSGTVTLDRESDAVAPGAHLNADVIAGKVHSGKRFYLANQNTNFVNGGASGSVQLWLEDEGAASSLYPELVIRGAFTNAREVVVADSPFIHTATLGGTGDHDAVFSGTITLRRNLRIISDAQPPNRLRILGAITDTTNTFGLVKDRAGWLTLSGTNTFKGGLTISSGVVEVANANALGTSGSISFGGGVLRWASGITNDFSSRFSTAAGQTFRVDVADNTVTFASALAGSGNALVKLGEGRLHLSGHHTLSGPTTVEAGSLVGVSGGSLSNSALTVSGGATNGVRLATAGGQWTVTNLTYGAGATALELDFAGFAPSVSTAPLRVNGNVTIGGTLEIQLLNTGAFSPGTYPLLEYTGTLTGTLPSAPVGIDGAIVHDTVAKRVNLVITKFANRLYMTAGGSSVRVSSNNGSNWSVFVSGGSTFRGVAVDPRNGAVFVADAGAGTAAARPLYAYNAGGVLLASNTFDSTGGFNQVPVTFHEEFVYVSSGAAGGSGQGVGFTGFDGATFANSPLLNASNTTWQANDMTGVSSGTNRWLFMNGVGGTGVRRATLGTNGASMSSVTLTLSPESGTFPANFTDVAVTYGGRILALGQGTSGSDGLWVSTNNVFASNTVTLSRLYPFGATENPSAGDPGGNARDMVLLGNRLYIATDSRVYEYVVDEASGTLAFRFSATHGFSSSSVQISGRRGREDFTWSGAASPNTAWGAGGNWVGGSMPDNGDDIEFPDVTHQVVGVGAIRQVGALTFSAPDPYTFSGGSLASASNQFTIKQTATGTVELGSAIVGDSSLVILGGGGTFALNASNRYTGPTSVSNATLLVNAPWGAGTGAVTVAAGATLGGTGVINGAVTLHGHLAPGAGGIGRLTVSNDVTWNASSVWRFELGTGTNSDQLVIAGAGSDFLKGSGGTFLFDFQGGGDVGSTYTLVAWTGVTTFALSDFSFTNLASGLTGLFQISGKSLLFTVLTATPTSRTWTGSASGAWSNPANWDGMVTIPLPGDDLVFPDVVNQSITLGADRIVRDMIFSAPDAYTFDSANRLFVNGQIQPTGLGPITFNGPITFLTNLSVSGAGTGELTFAGALVSDQPAALHARVTVSANNSTTLTAGFRWTVGGNGRLTLNSLNAAGYNPAAMLTNYFTLNGGILRLGASLGALSNRGIAIGSLGATIDVNNTFSSILQTNNGLHGSAPLTLINGGALIVDAPQTSFTGVLRFGAGGGAGASAPQLRWFANANGSATMPNAIEINDAVSDGPTILANFASGPSAVNLQGNITFVGQVFRQPHFFVTRNNGALISVEPTATLSAGTAGNAAWFGFRAGINARVTNRLTIAGTIADGAGRANVAYADNAGNWVSYVVSGNNTYSGGGALASGTPFYGNALGTHLQQGWLYWTHENALGADSADNPITIFRQTGGQRSPYAALLGGLSSDGTLGNRQRIQVRPLNSVLSLFMIGSTSAVQTTFGNLITVTNAAGAAPPDLSSAVALLLHQASGGRAIFTNAIVADSWTAARMRAPVLEKTGAGIVELRSPNSSYKATPVIRNGILILGADAPATGDTGAFGDPTSDDFGVTNAIHLGGRRPAAGLTSVRVVTVDDLGGAYNPSGGANGIGQLTSVTNGSVALDGVTLAVNDRVLLILQGDSSSSSKVAQNGIYRVTSVSPTVTLDRESDAVAPGSYVTAQTDAGLIHSGKRFYLANQNTNFVNGGASGTPQVWLEDEGGSGTLHPALLADGPRTIARRIVVNDSPYIGSARLGVHSADAALFSGGIELRRDLILMAHPSGVVRLAGDVFGTGGLRVTNAVATLEGTYTYSGNTIVSGGRLELFGGGPSLASPLITVAGGAQLAVTGRTDGALTLAANQTLDGTGEIVGEARVRGGRLNPAGSNAVGSLTMGALSLSNGLFRFNVTNATLAAGTGWDLLVVTGALDIVATSANRFTVDVVCASGTLPGFDGISSQSWKFAQAASIAGFSADKFTIRTNEFAPGSGVWTVSQVGGDLYLNFAAGATTDLRVSITNAPSVVYAGTVFTNRITVTNAGPEDAIVYVVTNVYDAAQTYISSTPAGSHSAGQVVWSLMNLPAGSTTTLLVRFTAPTYATTVTNAARVALVGTDTAPANDSATNTTDILCIPGAVPYLTMPASKTVTEGNLLSFTVIASNLACGSPIALNASALPSGASFTVVTNALDYTGTFTWTPSLTQNGTYPVSFKGVNSGGFETTKVMLIYVADTGESTNSAGVPLSQTNWAVAITNIHVPASGNVTVYWSAAVGVPYDVYMTSDPFPLSGAVSWTKVVSAHEADASSEDASFSAGGVRRYIQVVPLGFPPTTNGVWGVIRPTIPPGFSMMGAPLAYGDLSFTGAFGQAIASALSGSADRIHIWTNGWLTLDRVGTTWYEGSLPTTNKLKAGQGFFIENSGPSATPRFSAPLGNVGTNSLELHIGDTPSSGRWTIIGPSEGRTFSFADGFAASKFTGTPSSNWNQNFADVIAIDLGGGVFKRIFRAGDGTWRDASTLSVYTGTIEPWTAVYYFRYGNNPLSINF